MNTDRPTPPTEPDTDHAPVLAVLRGWPDAPAPDLADRVLATVRRRLRVRIAAVAAGLLALAGATVVLRLPRPELVRSASTDFPEHAPTPAPPAESEPPPDAGTGESTDPALAHARDWLVRVQDDDGGWAMGRTGAGANYAVGTSALAVLALLEHDDPASRAAAERGVDFLLASQSSRGLFGPPITGSLYNHVLATYALLRAAREDNRATAALDAAIALLVETQGPQGGWTYLRAAGDPNSSLTAWALLVLAEARAAGHAGLDTSIRDATRWIAGTVDAEGRAGYRRPGDHPHGSETLTAAVAWSLMRSGDRPSVPVGRMLDHVRQDATDAPGEMDLYRAFLQAAALRAEDGNGAGIGPLATRLRSLQEPAGSDAGSWPPLDRWSSAGGRVYSTALAMLTLR